MRTVSFKENLTFLYDGMVSSNALSFGDVDNDGKNEMFLGTTSGDIFIYKFDSKYPWKTAGNLHMITSVGCGPVCNTGKNLLVCLTVEGWCYFFDISPTNDESDNFIPSTPFDSSSRFVGEEAKPELENDEGDAISANHSEDDQFSDFDNLGESQNDFNFDANNESMNIYSNAYTITPSFQQKLLPNNKCFCITDINKDGEVELVIGYSDRKVRAFKWSENEFKLVEEWTLAGLLGSVSWCNNPDLQSVDLIVSQPGGTYCTLKFPDSDKVNSEFPGPYLFYHPLGSRRARNPDISTEVIGNIKRCKDGETVYYSAICTLDGTITVVDYDRIIWSLIVDRKLFSLHKIDIMGDGSEEIVACSWDGHTYIISLDQDVVRFDFPQHVASFSTGSYCSTEKDYNKPCLAYASFDGCIRVYNNLPLSSISIKSLESDLKQNAAVKSIIDQYFASSPDPTKATASAESILCQLSNYALYGLSLNLQRRLSNPIHLVQKKRKARSRSPKTTKPQS
ncbi:DgyrCDS7246 [Dimorphilus gyrociliatus]|uniref:DgyrCDS7246 n=1 Tax=Dimorphilus gyrociliatus TaxID=2664684 RepID=A0A7I8VVF7_9ANNE|nr:DgyrCDS7246 [Dimorphilus gyrociliatus]